MIVSRTANWIAIVKVPRLCRDSPKLGCGLIAHRQKMTEAAMATADMKV